MSRSVLAERLIADTVSELRKWSLQSDVPSRSQTILEPEWIDPRWVFVIRSIKTRLGINLLVSDQAGRLRNNLPSCGCCPPLRISLDEVVDEVPIAEAFTWTCPVNSFNC